MSSGCGRHYCRQKTDGEIYALLDTGEKCAQLDIRDYRIEPQQQSRTAHLCDDWKRYLPADADRCVPLDKETAVDLALLHSPEYQSAKENLYLSAASVSQERFRFDVQFFGGDSVFYTLAGRLKGGTSLEHQPFVNAALLTAAGGEIVAGLANSVTWTFNGKSSWSADSILNISLVQPLLRGAGRQVVLENLTQNEHNFLSAMRQMVFFQQGYYTKIVTGSGAQSAPSGTSGSAFTPSSAGGFYGLLAEQVRIQNQRQNIFALEENLNRFIEIFEAGQVTDVYQVEETRQNLLNSESNFLSRVSRYETSVETFVRSLGLPPDLKVKIDDPLMQQFQLSSPTLTDLQTDVGNILAAIRKKDKPLPNDFMNKLKAVIERCRSEIKVLQADLADLDKSIPARKTYLKSLAQIISEKTADNARIDKNVYDTAVFDARITKLKVTDIPRNLSRIDACVTLIETVINTDEASLRQMITDRSFNETVMKALETLNLNETSILDREEELFKKQKEFEEKQNELQSLRQAFDKDTPAKDTSAKDTPQREQQKIIAELRQKDTYRDWVRRILSAFQYELVSLSLMQTRTRLDAVTLIPVTMTPEDALNTAVSNRLDWLNEQSALQDARRHIEIAADRLKGDLNVTFDGKLGTLDQDGLDFSSKTGQMMLGLEWDSPLTRHNEMLDLRRAQIAYQDARRNYYSYVDSVNAQLRLILRNLQMHQVEFEIGRNAILTDAVRVDVMQLRMEQPPRRGEKIDTNTATQLISALNGFMDSQNSFLDTWVAYQTQRMLLDLNLGTMQLSPGGHWLDKDKTVESAAQSPQPLPAPVLNKRYVMP
ncbi:MAG: hypothetical protein LBT46_14245 [Planctomycetaceae bacterium]|jgi:hypothetical protein|nr:hypothetical protein [Planctomycetaceae bacterium]